MVVADEARIGIKISILYKLVTGGLRHRRKHPLKIYWDVRSGTLSRRLSESV